MTRFPLKAPLGLMESSPAGAVPLGHTDEELNVRDFDDRGQRMRPASRSGLLPLGTPCAASSPVTHSFTAKRPVARYEFVELDTVATADTEPGILEEKWSSTFPADPVSSARTPLGMMVTLLSTGEVWETLDDGEMTLLFSIDIPIGFVLVPSIAVDENEGIHVAAASPRVIDDGATRFYKHTKDGFGDWSVTVESDVFYTVERFWYDSGDIFCASHKPEDTPSGPDYAVSRQGGALTGRLAETWAQQAAAPVLDMAFRAGSVYLAIPPDGERSANTGGKPATIDWTPRELAAANHRLYSQHSSIRDALEFGYTPGVTTTRVYDMRGDESQHATILDTTVRNAATQETNGAGFTLPSFTSTPLCIYNLDPSADGFGSEVTIPHLEYREEAFLGNTYWWAVSPVVRFGSNTTNEEKADPADLAPWARGITPGMDDGVGILSTRTKWAMSMLVRVVNYAQGESHEPTSGGGAPRWGAIGYSDWKIIWQHAGFSLRYRGFGTSPADETDIEFALDTPNLQGTPVAATQFAGGSDNIYSFTLAVEGYDAALATTYWRINGVQIGGAFVPGAVTEVGYSSYAGVSNATDYQGTLPGAGLQIAPMRGGLKEYCCWLGSTTTDPHDTAVTAAEIDQVEGYMHWAHGAASLLDSGHTYFATAPAGAGDIQGSSLAITFQDPHGQTAKMDRADGKLRWVRINSDTASPQEGAAGYTVTVDPREDEKGIYTSGTALDQTAAAPTRIERIDDEGDDYTLVWDDDLGGSSTAALVLINQSAKAYVDQKGAVYWPFTMGRTPTVTAIERRNPATGVEDVWTGSITIAHGPTHIFPGGLYVDDSYKAGAVVDQFVYVICRATKRIKRFDLAGRRDTGETRDQITDQLAICESGVVARRGDGAVGWTELVNDFTPGGRPWSFEFFGQHFFGGPEDYRVYDANRQILRQWTPNEGSLIPGRIFIAERWRGRALVVSEDDRHILYGSAYGDAFDFRTGGAIVTATQAFAGTTAAAGAIPDPITAVVVANDDLCYVGTNRSVWRLTGDPQTGGQLDDVLASEGILGPYAHARGDSGEIYWMTSALRILQISGSGMADLSSDSIRGRLQAIDRDKYRVELTYSDREQGLYVTFFPRSGYEVEVEHVFWSKRSGRWHPVQFSGGIDRALTCAAVLESADAGGWGALWGFADGGLRFVHPEALDDDGEPIASRMRLPIGGDGDPNQSLITKVELVLADDQGPVRVAGVAGRTGQTGGDYGPEKMAVPGRGNLLQIQVAGFNTWLSVVGTGQPWAIDSMAAHVHSWRLG